MYVYMYIYTYVCIYLMCICKTFTELNFDGLKSEFRQTWSFYMHKQALLTGGESRSSVCLPRDWAHCKSQFSTLATASRG